MSRPELATYVHVADEHGQMHVFGPDTDMSKSENAWAVPKIVNPKAWVGGKAPGPVESPQDEMVRLQARINALKAAIGDGGGESQDDAPPPKGGPGSGAPAWRTYAASKQVDVPADASREECIEALERAGVPTE